MRNSLQSKSTASFMAVCFFSLYMLDYILLKNYLGKCSGIMNIYTKPGTVFSLYYISLAVGHLFYGFAGYKNTLLSRAVSLVGMLSVIIFAYLFPSSKAISSVPLLLGFFSGCFIARAFCIISATIDGIELDCFAIGLSFASVCGVGLVIMNLVKSDLVYMAFTCVVSIVLLFLPEPKDSYEHRQITEETKTPAWKAVHFCLMLWMMSALVGLICMAIKIRAVQPLWDNEASSKLCFMIGALFAGLFGQRSRQSLVPVLLCAMCASCISIINLSEGIFNSGAAYLFLGFLNVFLTISFSHFSCMRENSALLANLGRVIYCAAIGSVCCFATGFSVFFIMLISLVVIIICFSLYFVSGESKIISMIHNREQNHSFEEFAEVYNFTDIETQIAKALIELDCDMKELAEKLYISERGLYRHAAKIYEKTNTSGRTALVKLFFQNVIRSEQEK